MKQLKSKNGAHCKTLKSANFRNRKCIFITSGTGLSPIVRVGHSTSADYYGGRKSNFGFLSFFALLLHYWIIDIYNISRGFWRNIYTFVGLYIL